MTSNVSTELGSCCNCTRTDGVHTMIQLRRRAPVPGTGWGCYACKLPADGALAVLCERCAGDAPTAVCVGYPGDNKRISIHQLTPDAFNHDPDVPH